MWQHTVTELFPNTLEFKLFKNEHPLSFRDTLEFWQEDQSFVDYFNQLLVESPFEAFLFETPPMNSFSLEHPFEFVLLESSSLARVKPDQFTYRSYFQGTKTVSFPNRSGDAMLVVPSPLDPSSNYAHLANFVRLAPPDQIVDFWKKVGTEYEKAINENYLWLSTHGLGVFWVHMRIDTYPKYYHHRPYKST